MQVKELFPIPLGILDLKTNVKDLREINKNLIKSFIESLIDNGYKNSTGIMDVYQSNRSLEDSKPEIKSFLKLIKPFVDSYFNEIRFSESFLSSYELSGVWGNLTAGIGAHTSHVHGKGSHQPFSFVYFPCTFVNPENLDDITFSDIVKNEDDIGSLLLYSPGWEIKEITFNQNDSYKNNKFNQLIYSIQPKEGLLVVFPSFLSHLVTPSRAASKTNARISFSFFANIK